MGVVGVAEEEATGGRSGFLTGGGVGSRHGGPEIVVEAFGELAQHQGVHVAVGAGRARVGESQQCCLPLLTRRRVLIIRVASHYDVTTTNRTRARAAASSSELYIRLHLSCRIDYTLTDRIYQIN